MKTIQYGVALLTLLLLAACTSTGSKELTAEGLFSNFVEKAYGKDGMASPGSYVMSGRIIVEDFGVEGPLKIKQMAPSYMRSTGEIMGMVLDSGCNANVCWEQQPGQNAQAVTGAQKDFMLSNADFTRWEHVDDYYTTMEIVPAEDEATVDHYKVRAVTKDGKEDSYYFSKESGLMVGAQMNAITSQGSMNILTRFNNYKEFDGTLVATQLVQETPMATIKLEIENVEFVPLASSDFEAPAGIK